MCAIDAQLSLVVAALVLVATSSNCEVHCTWYHSTEYQFKSLDIERLLFIGCSGFESCTA